MYNNKLQQLRRKKECNCKVVTPQSAKCYRQMITMIVPDTVKLTYNWGDEKRNKEMVSVDPCIAAEVYTLWLRGIRTTGSCCGHNLSLGDFISVQPEDIQKMKDMGYVTFPHPEGRKDHFYTKTLTENEQE